MKIETCSKYINNMDCSKNAWRVRIWSTKQWTRLAWLTWSLKNQKNHTDSERH